MSSSTTITFPVLIVVLLPNQATTANTTSSATAATVPLISVLGNRGWRYIPNSTPNSDTIVGISSVENETNAPAMGCISLAAHRNCDPLAGSAAEEYVDASARRTTTAAAPISAHTTPAPYSFATVGSVPKIPEPTMQPMPISNAPSKPIFFFSISISLLFDDFTDNISFLHE